MSKKEPLKVSYVNFGENYLVVTENGDTVKITGRDNFHRYLKDNNCKTI